ncbi:MAG: Uma2 family endonuclease [Phormidesmis sp.]
MTYTPIRYRSYQEYLDDDRLNSEVNYRLLSTGELIEVASEDDENLRLAIRLMFALEQLPGLMNLVRNGSKEIQVNPVGDQQVNRKPDVVVMQPEHLASARQAITLGMQPPQFVAELVSPGPASSDNYKRDYVWKRSQYAQIGIPEYWIVDRHRQKVTVLVLAEETYKEAVYEGDQTIISKAFPSLTLTAKQVLAG